MRKRMVSAFLCMMSLAVCSGVAAGQEYGKGQREVIHIEVAEKEQVTVAGVPQVLYGGVAEVLAEETHNIENDMASYEQRQVQLTESSYRSESAEEKQRVGNTDKNKKKSKKKEYQSYMLPFYAGYSGTKTYEKYCAITSRVSLQWELQQAASTDENGLRVVNDRYCVAIGSYFATEIGQYFDLVLENGTVIPCIMGDAKSDKHTDPEYHIFTVKSKCCSEFIVDAGILSEKLGSYGDVSKLFSDWDSPVVEVRVYQKNYFSTF